MKPTFRLPRWDSTLRRSPCRSRPRSGRRSWPSCRRWRSRSPLSRKNWLRSGGAAETSTMKCSACGKKSELPKRPMSSGAILTTTARRRPAPTLSTSCSVRPDGSSTRPRTGSTRSPDCHRPSPARARSTTSCGMTTVGRSPSWKPRRRVSRRWPDRSRRGSMRTRLSVSSVRVRSSSTPTGMRPGSGTTATGIRPGQSRVSTRRTNCVR